LRSVPQTEQTQLAGAWYPLGEQGDGAVVALTHQVHTQKRHFDLTPGQNLTFKWGISQYLPLTSDQKLLAEVGPAGYDSWQMTSDSGKDASSTALDRVHGAGVQLGMTYVPWGAVVNLRYMYEYAAVDRFQGQAFGLNFAKAF
jgi:hypothetical protein